MNILKKRLINALVISVTAFQAQTALANNFYVRADGGAAWMKDQTVTSLIGSPPLGPGTVLPSTQDLSFDTAFQGQIGIGYHVKPYLRVDLTGVVSNKFEMEGICQESTVCPAGQVTSADISYWQMFANTYLDFGPLLFKQHNWFNPYVGVGLGFAHNEVTNLQAKNASGQLVSTVTDNTQDNFAWRAMVGMGLIFTESFSLDISYTYTDAGKLTLGKTVTTATSPPIVFDQVKVDDLNMRTQQLMLGAQYHF